MLSFLDGSMKLLYVGRMPRREQRIQSRPERPDHQSMHHTFEDSVYVEELSGLELQTLLLNFFLELALAVLHEVVLHARHELSDVAHYYLLKINRAGLGKY